MTLEQKVIFLKWLDEQVVNIDSEIIKLKAMRKDILIDEWIKIRTFRGAAFRCVTRTLEKS